MAQSPVIIKDVYDPNGIAYDDVTAGEASAGDASAYSVTLKNYSTKTINHLVSWIDSSVNFIEISNDGIVYVSPKSTSRSTPDDALELADIKPGSSITFYLKRTIPAGTSYDPKVYTIVHWSFFGLLN